MEWICFLMAQKKNDSIWCCNWINMSGTRSISLLLQQGSRRTTGMILPSITQRKSNNTSEQGENQNVSSALSIKSFLLVTYCRAGHWGWTVIILIGKRAKGVILITDIDFAAVCVFLHYPIDKLTEELISRSEEKEKLLAGVIISGLWSITSCFGQFRSWLWTFSDSNTDGDL